NLAVERVTLAAAGLSWPHYFVDLGGVGSSADPSGNLVVIAACTQLAPAPSVPPASGAPAASASSSASSALPGSSAFGPGASPSASTGAGQGCRHPELIALNL
ncbi:MAG TPA: hypothetical protein VGU21_02820, partial [Streptosporangiaceae bacterium]|nr:hypothetical protein [Streptosporangiaceae bacterium]